MLEGVRHDDVHPSDPHLYRRRAKAKLYLEGVRAFGSVWFGFVFHIHSISEWATVCE